MKINRLYELLANPVILDEGGVKAFKEDLDKLREKHDVSIEEAIHMAFMKGFHAGIKEALRIIQL